MSIGSENQDFIGIALFGKHLYAFGELSMIKIWKGKRSGVRSLSETHCFFRRHSGIHYLSRY